MRPVTKADAFRIGFCNWSHVIIFLALCDKTVNQSASTLIALVQTMSTLDISAMKAASREQAKPSQGVHIVAKYRPQMSKLTDTQRAELRHEAMAKIYSSHGSQALQARRR